MGKKLDGLTKLEAEKLSKRNAYEATKRLEVLGQENERKAAKWVSEAFRETEGQDELLRQQALFNLNQLKKNKINYGRFLAQLYLRFLEDEDISPKYKIWTKVKKEGVSMGIKGTKFVGAFKPSGIVEKDFMYVKILSVKTGNTIAKLDGYIEKSEGGVLIPDQVDKKKYARQPNVKS